MAPDKGNDETSRAIRAIRAINHDDKISDKQPVLSIRRIPWRWEWQRPGSLRPPTECWCLRSTAAVDSASFYHLVRLSLHLQLSLSSLSLALRCSPSPSINPLCFRLSFMIVGYVLYPEGLLAGLIQWWDIGGMGLVFVVPSDD